MARGKLSSQELLQATRNGLLHNSSSWFLGEVCLFLWIERVCLWQNIMFLKTFLFSGIILERE